MSENAYTVARVVQTLELLAFAPLSAVEIARALRVHPRTARRMLRRLAQEQYVSQPAGPGGAYELTLRLPALAAHGLSRSPLITAAREPLATLATNLGAVSTLVVPAYTHVLCIAQHGRDDPGPGGQLGRLVPSHCAAGGRVLLAHRARWRESVLERALCPLTTDSITHTAVLRAQLDEIRERGWARENSEQVNGESAIAAPVIDQAGEVIAAIETRQRCPKALAVRTRAVIAAARAVTKALHRARAA